MGPIKQGFQRCELSLVNSTIQGLNGKESILALLLRQLLNKPLYKNYYD